MRKRIAIIGATGMLGSSVYGALKDKCDLVLTARSADKFDQLDKVYGGVLDHTRMLFNAVHPMTPTIHRVQDLAEQIGDVDMVINCIGVLNKFRGGQIPTPHEYYMINTELPIALSMTYGSKLIHPSTDCVFDGKNGPYTENSPPAPSYGLYGYTKIFADVVVQLRSQVFRCCLLGEELDPDAFQMFTWFKRQERVEGYNKWVISPITGVEFGKVCWRILDEGIEIGPNLLHIATPPLSKYRILQMYRVQNGLEVEVRQDDNVTANKVLVTEYPEELAKLRIADFGTQLDEL